MDPDSGTGSAGLDLSRMPARPREVSRRPVAGAAAMLCVILILGGAMMLQSDGSDPAGVPLGQVDTVTRQSPPEMTLARPATLRDPSSEPVSHLIRRPVRLTDRNASGQDLRAQTRQVLAGFGHVAVPDDRLQQLLLRTLAQGQSDAYIHAALNAAAARGEFVIPAPLRTHSGGMDTARLLAAYLESFGG
ncbi:hypothetical protein [Roseobacter ponti]|uniref:Uncharacterized protein n=1 Tax=Roseobacter ponti TaxID=1891787 RepID=A0A858SMY1_9RHOB|nr:hypothetical protein [Roseobacter ponti]QJF49840.1 hypothetical protein G3256_00980 [Roseobacter ponti]